MKYYNYRYICEETGKVIYHGISAGNLMQRVKAHKYDPRFAAYEPYRIEVFEAGNNSIMHGLEALLIDVDRPVLNRKYKVLGSPKQTCVDLSNIPFAPFEEYLFKEEEHTIFPYSSPDVDIEDYEYYVTEYNWLINYRNILVKNGFSDFFVPFPVDIKKCPDPVFHCKEGGRLLIFGLLSGVRCQSNGAYFSVNKRIASDGSYMDDETNTINVIPLLEDRIDDLRSKITYCIESDDFEFDPIDVTERSTLLFDGLLVEEDELWE